MDNTLLPLLSFLAVAVGITAIGLMLRDLFAPAVPKPHLRFLDPQEQLPPPERRSIDQWLTWWLNRAVLEGRLPFNALSAALLIVVAGVALSMLLYVWNEDFIAAIAGLVIGVATAALVLEWYRWRRVNEVTQQLPGVIDQIARAVRAGESLDQALAVVAAGLKEPLGPELRAVCKQLQMGLSVPAALQSLYQRLPLVDVQILVSTLSVYRDVGGNLASNLEKMAAMLRDRVHFRRQVRANTAAGRFAALFLVLVTPSVFLYFYFFRNSSIMPVFSDSVGLVMLGVAALLEVFGLIWVWSVIRLKY